MTGSACNHGALAVAALALASAACRQPRAAPAYGDAPEIRDAAAARAVDPIVTGRIPVAPEPLREHAVSRDSSLIATVAGHLLRVIGWPDRRVRWEQRAAGDVGDLAFDRASRRLARVWLQTEPQDGSVPATAPVAATAADMEPGRSPAVESSDLMQVQR